MKYKLLRFPQGKTKAVTFSYDDGCREDLKTVEVLNKYGLKATFNIHSGCIATESGGWTMTEEEIRDSIVASGHEIAVHGYWHKAPGLTRTIEGIKDVLDNRLDLEKRFGGIIRGMAYPDSGILDFVNGSGFQEVKNYLKELDIAYARTLGGDNNRFQLPQDWLNWVPTAHHDNPNILAWAKEFVDMDVEKMYFSSKHAKLFYVWGHSFEFERNGNWERLEEICQILSGKEDIWYATNMQIYEYVTAYRSLVYSADGNTVYNPTLMEVWMDNDGTLCSVKPGETVQL